jgi:16S rRNA (guanine966-N2)-methyltransferase
VRIIGGVLRGRRLRAKPSATTRPTSDRVREAIASVLEARDLMRRARVLDLFAGTGALGFEALSRGAEHALLVDCDRHALRAMRENSADLGLGDRVRTLELDLLGPLASVHAALHDTGLGPFTLVFMDAPYAQIQVAVTVLERLAGDGLLAATAPVVLEHATRMAVQRPARFAELGTYRYGDTGVMLWETIACEAQT